MSTLFLAYAAADRHRGRALADGLGSAGLTVGIDADLAGDEGWWAGVLAAIQEAEAFLYATTPANAMPRAISAELDYAAALGIPTLQIHLAGPGAATGIDFREPDADAAFRLIGAIAGLPPRPITTGWQPTPQSPFAAVADLAREVRAPALTSSDQRSVADRLRAAAFDPAARELTAILRLRTDLDPEIARRLDEAQPPDASQGREPDAMPGTSPDAMPGTGPGARREATPGTRPGAMPETRPRAMPGPELDEGPGGTADTRAEGEQVASSPWSRPGALTAADVHAIAFRKAPFGRRGYDEESVDKFLDQVESDLRSRQAGGALIRVALTAADVQAIAFVRPPFGRRGYDEEEVDTFLDEIHRSLTVLDRDLTARGTKLAKA